MTNSDCLRLILDGLLRSEPQDIDVDMSDLTFADCAGASVLVSVHNRLAERGQKLTLIAPRPIVRRLLDASGLDKLLRIREAVTGLDELVPTTEPADENDDPGRTAPA